MPGQAEGRPQARPSREASIAEPETMDHELPAAVGTLIEARTGDTVYVVGPDYRIVHWDHRMESLSGVLSEEVLGKLATRP